MRHRDANRAVAQYIAERTERTDKIFILSGSPVIYFLANRESAVKYYFYLQYDSRWSPITPGQKESALDAFRKNAPKYFVQDIRNRGTIPYLEDFMRQNYRLEQIIGPYLVAKVVRENLWNSELFNDKNF